MSEAGSSHGSLYKATQVVDGITMYYKMSLMIGRKVVGHEAVNGVIVSRLLDILNIPHVQYDLKSAVVRVKDNTFTPYVCASKDFKNQKGTSMPLEVYYSLVYHPFSSAKKKSPFELLIDMGFRTFLNQLFVVDFLIINRDRHGYNIELISEDNSFIPAPLFDNGMSFIAPLNNNLKLIQAYDPLCDEDTNNFIGFESLYDNLDSVDCAVGVSPLSSQDKKWIMHDLSLVVSKEHLNKIWKIIWIRYNYLLEKGYIHESNVKQTSLFD